jgi:hypothetical protein
VPQATLIANEIAATPIVMGFMVFPPSSGSAAEASLDPMAALHLLPRAAFKEGAHEPRCLTAQAKGANLCVAPHNPFGGLLGCRAAGLIKPAYTRIRLRGEAVDKPETGNTNFDLNWRASLRPYL